MTICSHPDCARRPRGRDLITGAPLCARHLRRAARQTPGRFTTETTTPTTETRST